MPFWWLGTIKLSCGRLRNSVVNEARGLKLVIILFSFSPKMQGRFIGFGGGSAEAEPGRLRPETEQTLRALSKKNVMTKITALTRFREIEAPQETKHAELLRLWTTSSRLTALDPDWRVRVEVWKTWEALVKIIGRGAVLQKALRSVIGVWLTGTFDLVADVSTAARRALPISEAKYDAALDAFTPQLLQTLKTQLAETPESLAEGRSFVSEKDARQMWENLTVASLQLARHLAARKPEGEFADFLLSQSVLRHFGDSDAAPRRALLDIVATCSAQKTLHGDFRKKGLALALASLNEPQLRGLGTLAQLLGTEPELWREMNAEKVLWPPLWKLLRGSSAGETEAQWVLPLVAACPVPMEDKHARGLVQQLGAALWDLSRRLKVRSSVASVLGHLADCLAVAATRLGPAALEAARKRATDLPVEWMHLVLAARVRTFLLRVEFSD